MKSFRKLVSEVAQPKAEDEINFKAKHEIEKIPHPQAGDETFKGAKGKSKPRRADYKNDEDEDVYEATQLDPVDKTELKGKFKKRDDKDIDNDGDVDSSDKYLHKRRKAISKAMKKEEIELDEKAESEAQAIAARIALRHKRAGTKPEAGTASAEMMDMPEKDLEDYIKTKKGAPYKVDEEAEQLDEISKKTLGSYVNKASQDMADNAYQLGAKDPLQPKGSWKKNFKRGRGIEKAVSRLTKKEARDINENAWEEIPMMKRQLHFIAYAAEEIMEYLGDCEVDCIDPEEWFQNKLAHVHGQMRTLHAYMEGDQHMMGMDMYGETYQPGAKDVADDHGLDSGARVSKKAWDRLKKSKKNEESELSELSRKTLANYTKKAARDMSYARGTMGREPNTKRGDKAIDTIVKRSKGINRATSLLAKEEVETLEEYSNWNVQHPTKPTKSYKVKARTAGEALRKGHSAAVKAGHLSSNVSPEIFRPKHLQKEETDLGEVTRSAVKRPEKYTDERDITRTRMTSTKPVNRDEHGQEKIKESLQEAVKSGRMKLDDGSSVTVSKKDADLLNQMFKDLNAKNRKMLQKTMMTDEAGFEEIVGFAREAL